VWDEYQDAVLWACYDLFDCSFLVSLPNGSLAGCRVARGFGPKCMRYLCSKDPCDWQRLCVSCKVICVLLQSFTHGFCWTLDVRLSAVCCVLQFFDSLCIAEPQVVLYSSLLCSLTKSCSASVCRCM
jgi:hypothetical protein